jgi:hypothetical protein
LKMFALIFESGFYIRFKLRFKKANFREPNPCL